MHSPLPSDHLPHASRSRWPLLRIETSIFITLKVQALAIPSAAKPLLRFDKWDVLRPLQHKGYKELMNNQGWKSKIDNVTA